MKMRERDREEGPGYGGPPTSAGKEHPTQRSCKNRTVQEPYRTKGVDSCHTDRCGTCDVH